jgi:hypothetical protein
MLLIPAFYPKENIEEYLDPKKMNKIIWYEPQTHPELLEAMDASIGIDTPIELTNSYRPIFEYPNPVDNQFLYRKLKGSRDYRGLFDPLDLFNLLYQQLKIILRNVHEDPQLVINHLAKLNLTKRKRHFLLYSLYYIINGLNGSPVDDEFLPVGIRPSLHKKLAAIQLEIFHEYRAVEKELQIDSGPEIFNNSRSEQSTGLPPVEDNSQGLTLEKIAMIHYYNKEIIARGDSADAIAHEKGYYSPNSGEKLYQHYSHWCDRTYRRALETKLKGKNKIRSIQEILQYLNESAKKEAQEQIKDLERRLNEDSY